MGVLVIVDQMEWALGTLYACLDQIPGVTVKVADDVPEKDFDGPDLVHFAYWNHWVEAQHLCNKSIVSIHHILHDRITEFIDRMAAEAEAIIVSDYHRLCQLGEYDIEAKLIPYWVDKEKHPRREWMESNGRFVAGILGREWVTPYKRFHVIREACEKAKVDLLDGGIEQDEQPKFDNINDFYKNIDCYVHASYIDAGPMPGLESLSRGIRVVTTPTGAMPMYCENGQTGYFTDGSVDDIVEKLKWAKRLGPNVERTPDIPGMDEWLTAHDDLYREVLR